MDGVHLIDFMICWRLAPPDLPYVFHTLLVFCSPFLEALQVEVGDWGPRSVQVFLAESDDAAVGDGFPVSATKPIMVPGSSNADPCL